MVKAKTGTRGQRGVPGPAGPPGPAGSTGTIGARGPAGRTGESGAIGLTGARGAKGSQGATPAPGKGRKRFIAAVDRHIENIYIELSTQMRRLAKLQAQVDELRDKIRQAL
jgi:hypothetical protein